jgi:hypothetical protein
VDLHDKDFNNIISSVKAIHTEEHCLEARGDSDIACMPAGGCMDFFYATASRELPVLIQTMCNSTLLEPYLKALPDLRVIVDHRGLGQKTEDDAGVLGLEKFANVFLKWRQARSGSSVAPTRFRGDTWSQSRSLRMISRHLGL